MAGAIVEAVGLGQPVAIDEIAADAVFRRDAAGVADRQRRVLQRTPDRPPDVDFQKMLLEPLLRFLGRKQIANPLRARFLGIVVMDVPGRLAHAGGAGPDSGDRADGVVEDHDLFGARGLGQKPLDLRVIDLFDLFFVVEIRHRRLMGAECETFFVQRGRLGQKTSVMHRHACNRVHFAPGRRRARGRLIHIEIWLAVGAEQIIQGRLHLRRFGGQ